MSRAANIPGGRPKPRSNVYTVLAFIAFASLATACGMVWWKNVELTKEAQDDLKPNRNLSNPMFVVDRAK